MIRIAPLAVAALIAGSAVTAQAGAAAPFTATNAAAPTISADITPVRFGGLRTVGGGFGESIGARNERGSVFQDGRDPYRIQTPISQLNPFGNSSSSRSSFSQGIRLDRSRTPGLRSPLRSGDVER
ncbi:MAG: hypothetical protein AAF367_07870 [Pseudomonadota bacterium]